MSERSRRLQVDIVSDVVCPWCVIGVRQLQQACDQVGVTPDIAWHPFQLNPHLTDEGEDLREHLARKYGTTPEASQQVRDRLSRMGAELGITFNYADDMRIYPTFRAHQVLHWADAQGKKHSLKMALFEAYFTHGRNVNDPDVLAEVASSVELDEAEARSVASDGRCADDVRAAASLWTERGVHAVPAMLLDESYLVSGAQGVENYVLLLRRLAERSATE